MKALENLRNFGGGIEGFSFKFLVKEKRLINNNNKYLDTNMNILDSNNPNINIKINPKFPNNEYVSGYWYANIFLGNNEVEARLSLEKIRQQNILQLQDYKSIIYKGLFKDKTKLENNEINIDEYFTHNMELQTIRIKDHKYDPNDVKYVINELTKDINIHVQKLAEILDYRLSATQIKKIRKILNNKDQLDNIQKYIDILMTGNYLISSVERQAQYDCKLISRKRIKKVRKGGERREEIDNSYSVKKSVKSKKDKLKHKAWNEGKSYKEVKNASNI